jgi:ribosomal protein S18 acetylase RimI-like enzyme
MSTAPETRPIHFRLDSGRAQRDRIQALVHAFADRHIHVLDLGYRLASPAFDASDVALWETDRGELTAFAVWQPAFKMLDYGVDPRCDDARFVDAMIEWIDESFAARAKANGRTTCWIKIAPAHREWAAVLEKRGFDLCAWSLAHYERPTDRVAQAELPNGFSIREVAGDSEAEAWAALHRAVFPRVGMTADWRLAIMRAPCYHRELDLVAVAPGGQLAAFCQGWPGSLGAEAAAQIEPFGTHPYFRRRHLGRAILHAIMRRMADSAIGRVFVEAWDDNLDATGAYESAGFRTTFHMPAYAKHFS